MHADIYKHVKIQILLLRNYVHSYKVFRLLTLRTPEAKDFKELRLQISVFLPLQPALQSWFAHQGSGRHSIHIHASCQKHSLPQKALQAPPI